MEDVRSLLFVPGDSERKIAKGLSSEADALILDLEDSVMPDKRTAARELCAAMLLQGSSKKMFVRINAPGTEDAQLDLAAVIKSRPYGVMVPKCRSSHDLDVLDKHLRALEIQHGVGITKVLPIVTETAASMFGTMSYQPGPRLVGMLWGGEDLAADIGASANRDELGNYRPVFELARSFCLLAATAAGAAPVDAVYTNFRDPDGLRAEASLAARDGFTAKAAIHPDQVAIINDVFTPTEADIARSRQIVKLFEQGGGAGVVGFEGRMLDQPHLKLAKRILCRVRAS